MRRFFTLIFSLCSFIASATDYYVSSTGNDSANGLSSSTPWKTIEKVNSEFSKINPGDRIFFRRGDVFYGKLSISKAGAAGNPITVSSYGTGSLPRISGFTTITSWTNFGGGIYSKAVTCESIPNILVLDGVNKAKGRWPNSGWKTIDSHSGSTSLTDSELPASPDWTGGEVVVRTFASLVDRSTISDHTGTSLTFTPLTQDPINGVGYFIQNHRSALDSFGEWCYTNGTLYMYFGSENPENHEVRVSTKDNLVSMLYKNYITIDYIHFEGANVNGIYNDNSDYMTVKNCIIENGGQHGIKAEADTDHILIENNTITNNNNIGIFFRGNTSIGNIIKNNNIRFSGYLLGMGMSGYYGYCGIINDGTGSLTTYNKVEFTGFCAIKFGGQNCEVSYNLINYCNLCKDDGAGIYSWRDYNTGKVIKNNIILNCLARPDGWYYYEVIRSHGIYLDGISNALVSNNTAAGNDGCGIFINAAQNVTAEYNTCYDNIWGIRILSETGGLARNHNINHNILVAKKVTEPSNTWNQSAFGVVSKLDGADIPQFGTSDYNYFARPVNNDNYIDVWKNAWGWAPGDRMAYNLSEWQSTYGKDNHSASSPVTISDTSKIRFEYNASTSNKVVSLDGSYVDVKGAKYQGSITLLPYTSAVLMIDPNPAAPPADPAYVRSAIENGAPAIIELNYNLTLANIIPATSAFSVQVNSAVNSVSSVSISGTKVLLTLSSPVAYGNAVTVAYTKPSSNPLQTAAGGQAANLTAQSVTNRVAAPPAPAVPSFSSATIENAAPSVIEMNYSISLANIIPATSSFSVQVNSAARSVSSVSISGTKVLLTLSSPVAYGNTVTVAYTKPSTNPLQTSAGGQAANLAVQSVTNRLAAPPPPPAVPVFSGATVENAAPSVIVMTYNLALAAIIPAVSAFSVTVNSTARSISSVSVSGTIVSLTLSSPVVYGNMVMVSYTIPSSNPLQTSAGGKAVSIAAQAVSNRVNAVAPPPVVVTPPVVVVPNTPPVVVVNYLGENYSGFTGVLNASGSYDANKDKLTYSWKIPDNFPVSSTNSSIIEYLAPVNKSKQTYEFVLTVSDGKTTQSKRIPVVILPYQPDLQTAEISSIEATDFNLTDVPSKAVDGNTSTMWSCKGEEQSLVLKLKLPFNIKHIMLAFNPGQAKESYFDIYCSTDGETWDLVLAKAKSCSFSGNFQIFDFPDSKAENEYSFIKLVGLGNSIDNWNYVSEFRIFGYPQKYSSDYEDLIVKIYPNPASDIVNILIDEPGFNPDFIKIVSLEGKILFTDKVDPGIRQLHVPVTFRPSIYFVQMGIGEITMFSQKLVVTF
jgi:uncharacterized repeat protein (TIGR02059 family)